MKRIAAATLAAAALFALVSAQTATQTQQKTNTTTTQQTSTNTSTAPSDTTTTAVDSSATMPVEDPIDTVDPGPAPEPTPVPRTGEKTTKVVLTSCPIHPEVKTRVAGKCPVCRMEERKQAATLEKTQYAPLAPPDATATPEPTPVPEPTTEPVIKQYDPSQPIP